MSSRNASKGSRSRVQVAKPSFGQEEENLLVETLRSGWVTQGPRVAEFEERFAAVVQARHAVAVSSGTTALFLALRVAGIGPGDEVIVPSLSFIATANAVVHTGATPVFVDIDPRTYNIDPDAAAAAVTARTRALLPVHQLGMPADLDRLQEVAKRHGLVLIEDAACAVGARYYDRPIGSSGNLVCFSFHPRKVLVSGEGGMIVTNDSDQASRLRRLRHQGMSVSDLERSQANRVIIESYPEVGYNFRLSDLHAAVAIGQLRKLDMFLDQRRAIAKHYDRCLAALDGVETPHVPDYAEPNYQSYIVRLRGFDRRLRNRILDEMLRRGVATRRGLMAIHLEACYLGARISGTLEHCEAADAQTMLLPIYPGLSEEDQAHVIHQFEAALDEVKQAKNGELSSLVSSSPEGQ